MLCSEGGVADGRAGGCRSISVYVGHGQIIIMCHVCLRGFVVVVRVTDIQRRNELFQANGKMEAFHVKASFPPRRTWISPHVR